MKKIMPLFFIVAILVIIVSCAGESGTNLTPQQEDVMGLSATQGNARITLSWIDPSNSDLDHIQVTYAPEGNAVKEVAKGVGSLALTGLANNETYTFTVIAVSKSGKRSPGKEIQATPTVPDEKAPAEVGSFLSTVGDREVTLGWTEPGDADFAKVILSANGFSPVEVGKGTTGRVITGLTNFLSYTFIIKTVDFSGNVSAGVTLNATPNDEPGMIDYTNPLIIDNGDGTKTFTGDSNFQTMLRLIPPSVQARLDAAGYVPDQSNEGSIYTGTAHLSIDSNLELTAKSPEINEPFEVYSFVSDRWGEVGADRIRIDIAILPTAADAQKQFSFIFDNRSSDFEIYVVNKNVYGFIGESSGVIFYLCGRLIYKVCWENNNPAPFRKNMEDLVAKLGTTFHLNLAPDLVRALDKYNPAFYGNDLIAGFFSSCRKNGTSVPCISYNYKIAIEADPSRADSISDMIYFYPDKRQADNSFREGIIGASGLNDNNASYDVLDYIDGMEVLKANGYVSLFDTPSYMMYGYKGAVLVKCEIFYSNGAEAPWHGIMPQNPEDLEPDIDAQSFAQIKDKTLDVFRKTAVYYAKVETTDDSVILKNLSVSSGELKPAFDPAVTEYTLEIEGDINSSVAVSASAENAGYTVTINGAGVLPDQQIEVPLMKGRNFIDIMVVSDKPEDYKTYHVKVWKYTEKARMGDYDITNKSTTKWDFYAGEYSTITGTLSYRYLTTYYSNYSDHNLCYLDGLREIDGSLIISGSNANKFLSCAYGLEWLSRIGGMLTLNDNEILINLNGMNNIESIGGLQIANNPSLVSIGSIGTINNTSLTTLILKENPLLENIEPLSRITRITGDIVIGKQYTKNDLSGLRGIEAVDGNLEISNQRDQNVGDIPSVLPSLRSVGGKVKYNLNSSITARFDFGNSIDVKGLIFTNNDSSSPASGLLGIDGLENVTRLPYGLKLESNALLTDISSMKNIVSFGNCIRIISCVKLADIPFIGAIAGMSGWIYIANTGVSDLDFTNLVSIQKCDPDPDMNKWGVGNFQIYSNNYLETISCGKLVSAGDAVSIEGNPVLISINVDKLEVVESNLIIQDNKLLETLEIGSLTSVSGDLIIRDNPSLPGAVVDGIQARIDSGQLAVGGAIHLDGNGD